MDRVRIASELVKMARTLTARSLPLPPEVEKILVDVTEELAAKKKKHFEARGVEVDMSLYVEVYEGEDGEDEAVIEGATARYYKPQEVPNAFESAIVRKVEGQAKRQGIEMESLQSYRWRPTVDKILESTGGKILCSAKERIVEDSNGDEWQYYGNAIRVPYTLIWTGGRRGRLTIKFDWNKAMKRLENYAKEDSLGEV